VKKLEIEKFGLRTIADAVRGSDVRLAQLVGAVLEVSGKVQKRVKRDGQCKLVIAPDNVQLTVFADCASDVQNVISRKIRKGSPVRVKGKLQTFGASAVCLSDCRLLL
jgi:primosomal replication protein N